MKRRLRQLRLTPFARRVRLFPPVHAAWYATRWVGLRQRLRCPYCDAIGTWKPHGTFTARIRHKDRPVRRWLCKFCGMYNGPEGEVQAYPEARRGCWVLPKEYDPIAKRSERTAARVVPKAVLSKALPGKSRKGVNPWVG